MRLVISTIVLWIVPTLCVAEDPAAGDTSPKKPPSIVLFSDERTAGKGLLVTVDPVELPKDGPASVNYRITNFLEEEVFVEVRNGETLSYDHISLDGFHGFGNGSGFPGFPDNLALLKRLHASHYRVGQRITCGCAMAIVSAAAEIPNNVDPKERTTVAIYVRGFYRANGKEFSESIDVPLQLKSRVAR